MPLISALEMQPGLLGGFRSARVTLSFCVSERKKEKRREREREGGEGKRGSEEGKEENH